MNSTKILAMFEVWVLVMWFFTLNGISIYNFEKTRKINERKRRGKDSSTFGFSRCFDYANFFMRNEFEFFCIPHLHFFIRGGTAQFFCTFCFTFPDLI